ncbi:MAG: sulfur carrier protein ThiS [Methyloligellaceae bacterium]
MKIRIETTDELSTLMPGGVEEMELEIADGASPHDALVNLGIPKDRGFLLVVNEAVVPKAQRDNHMLGDGDTLQILPPLKGG